MRCTQYYKIISLYYDVRLGLENLYYLINLYIRFPKGLHGLPCGSPRSATMRTIAAHGCCSIEPKYIDVVSEKREGPAQASKRSITQGTQGPPKAVDPLRRRDAPLRPGVPSTTFPGPSAEEYREERSAGDGRTGLRAPQPGDGPGTPHTLSTCKAW